MLTVVETDEFLKAAAGVLSGAEREALVEYLSENPLAGEEIVGTGGLRKLRFGTRGRGKSGSARVIYFFYSQFVPVYLISCYAKNAKSDLSAAEINAYAKVTAAFKVHFRRNLT